MSPQRIQRRRTPGWRMPDAVYVGRGSKWGNPYRAMKWRGKWAVVEQKSSMKLLDTFDTKAEAHAEAVRKYRELLQEKPWYAPTEAEIRDALAGRDLARWCPLDMPCHADVLLDIANTDDIAPTERNNR